MPSRHERKKFIINGIYHVYNRGIDKNEIFHTDSDYAYFENSLMIYLTPPDQLEEAMNHSTHILSSKQRIGLLIRSHFLKNYNNKIELLAFCLMPNHFHLLISQKGERDISRFLKSLQTRYAMFHGKKYGRIGPLFQARYKGILVRNEAYYTTVKEYIHENPRGLIAYQHDPSQYPWSSLRDYLGKQKRIWVKART